MFTIWAVGHRRAKRESNSIPVHVSAPAFSFLGDGLCDTLSPATAQPNQAKD